MQYSFGSGSLMGRKLTTNGVTATNPTPVRFGGLQGVNIDMSFTTKELHGQYQFPIALARGSGKVTGKAQFAQLNALALNDLFFGESTAPATGALATAVAEVGTVTANTVTVTHNTTYVQDLGVVDGTTGIVLSRVANSPSGTGNYSVNETTGVYTFNTAMNNLPVNITYSWTDATTGSTITLTNKLMGSQPTFLAVFTEVFNGKRVTFQLNNCISSQLTFATKLEDFTIPDFTFAAFADASGNVGKYSFDE